MFFSRLVSDAVCTEAGNEEAIMGWKSVYMSSVGTWLIESDVRTFFERPNLF